jgi:predicted outer membrane protein
MKEHAMSVSRRTILAAGAAAAVPATLATKVFAAADAKGEDGLIATWMLIDGNKQIYVSKPVLDKGGADAKAFAQAEIDEHETVKKKLMEKGLQPLVPVGEMGGGMADPMSANAVLMMKNEIGKTCIENTNAEMSKKSGEEYDMAYIANQLEAHMMLKDTVQVAMKHASADLKPVLDEAMGVIETHLATLKSLKMKHKGH